MRALNVAPPDHYVLRQPTRSAKMVGADRGADREGLRLRARRLGLLLASSSDPGFGELADAAGYVGYDDWLRDGQRARQLPRRSAQARSAGLRALAGAAAGRAGLAQPVGAGAARLAHRVQRDGARSISGATVDIHGGGADLIFPHHACEIAQSENATGVRPFVRVWMHAAMVELRRREDEQVARQSGARARPAYQATARMRCA